MYAKSGYAPRAGVDKASQVVNDSSVPGDSVADALDNLSSQMAGAPFEDDFTLTAAQLASKAVYLTNTPRTGAPVTVRIGDAGVNLENKDFRVTGSTLSWAGLTPDGLLEQGDRLVVIYYI